MDEGFADALASLCSGELPLARRDPRRLAEMIERLVNALAQTIVVAGKGDKNLTSQLLEGASSQMFFDAIEKQWLGELLGKRGTN